jgi:hypothetical protein
MGRLAFVFGDELDKGGHDDQLEITGADDHLERYARAVRLLRAAGYGTVAVVTDHGFFHWDPAEDEVIPKPEGAVLWASRRAIAGHHLKHPTALSLKATAGDCECLVPRSVNAFKTYGGLGYFHGGATLQELVTPVVVARWPKKAQKIGVVLKPLGPIVRLTPTIEVAPAAVQRGVFARVVFGDSSGGGFIRSGRHRSLTCKHHDLDPFAYLQDVLSRLPSLPEGQLDVLLPDVWFTAHPAARRKTAA